MRKSNLLITLLILLATLSVAIFALLMDNKNEIKNHISIETDKVVRETLEINDLNLQPGAIKDHLVTVNAKIPGEYMVDFKFNEKGEGALKSYIDVEIEVGKTVVEISSLADLFLKNSIKHSSYMSDKEPMKILFRYTMPLLVGNEAQGAQTKFTVDLTFEMI